MRVKTIIFFIGVLIFAQIVFYNYIQKGNIELIDQKAEEFQRRINGLETEKSASLLRIERLKDVINSFPPEILSGFKDPEKKFVGFLDYLQSPVLEDVDAKVSLKGMQKYSEAPVPLHKTIVGIKFKFLKTYEAEKFLNYILTQKEFPLQVKELKAKRIGGGKSDGSLTVALLIPAKCQVPSLSSPESEGK